ncbi:MAG: response regulator transcription factor [Myxococcota bacterium]
MREVPLLVTRPDGRIMGANPAAIDVIGPCDKGRCAEAVDAEDVEGRSICGGCRPESFAPGEQREHGNVNVNGTATRLVCSAVDGVRVVTLLPPSGPDMSGPQLSPREREVLVLVARGFTSPSIAKRLGLTTATVRTHVEHIRSKLGVRTRSQAVARALALGQIE